MERKPAVVDRADEFYLRVEDVDDFYEGTSSRVTISGLGTFLNSPTVSLG